MKIDHSEYRRVPPGADTALIFIHGICGSPRQFDFLIEDLDDGYAVYNLLLPGHGGPLRAFNRSRMAKWQEYVDEVVLRPASRYDRIILVGHSMGCLLSMHNALSNPGIVAGLFLIAPPLVLWPKAQCIKNNLTFALGLHNASASLEAARAGCSVTAKNPLDHLGSLPRYLELMRVSYALRKRLSQLRLPILALHLSDDELVNRRSLSFFAPLPNTQTQVVPGAGHYYFPQKARDQMRAALKGFLKRC